MRGILYVLLIINAVYFFYNLLSIENQDGIIGQDISKMVNPYPDAMKLRILGEPVTIGGAASLSEQEAQAVGQPLCVAIGPFESMEMLRSFERQWFIGNDDVVIEVAELEKSGLEEYVLKADLEDNPGSAIYIIQRLQSFGFEGYLEIESLGSLIVVGRFRTEKEAQMTIDKLEKLNLKLLIVKERQDRSQYWIRIVKGVKINELRRRLSDYLRKYKGIILSQSLCE